MPFDKNGKWYDPDFEPFLREWSAQGTQMYRQGERDLATYNPPIKEYRSGVAATPAPPPTLSYSTPQTQQPYFNTATSGLMGQLQGLQTRPTAPTVPTMPTLGTSSSIDYRTTINPVNPPMTYKDLPLGPDINLTRKEAESAQFFKVAGLPTPAESKQNNPYASGFAMEGQNYTAPSGDWWGNVQQFGSDMADNASKWWDITKTEGPPIPLNPGFWKDMYDGATQPNKPDRNFGERLGASLYRAGVGDIIEGAGNTMAFIGNNPNSGFGAIEQQYQPNAQHVQSYTSQAAPAVQEAGNRFKEGYEIEPPAFKGPQSLFDPNYLSTGVARTVPTMALGVASAVPIAVATEGALLTSGVSAGLARMAAAFAGSAIGTTQEALMEAGDTYANSKGDVHAANQVLNANLGLLGLSNFAEFAIGLAKPKWLKNVPMPITAIGKMGLNAAIEGGQEGTQDVIQRNALGENLSYNPLQWDAQSQESAWVGALLGAAGTGAMLPMESIRETQERQAENAAKAMRDFYDQMPEEWKAQVRKFAEAKRQEGMNEDEAMFEAMRDLITAAPENIEQFVDNMFKQDDSMQEADKVEAQGTVDIPTTPQDAQEAAGQAAQEPEPQMSEDDLVQSYVDKAVQLYPGKMVKSQQLKQDLGIDGDLFNKVWNRLAETWYPESYASSNPPAPGAAPEPTAEPTPAPEPIQPEPTPVPEDSNMPQDEPQEQPAPMEPERPQTQPEATQEPTEGPSLTEAQQQELQRNVDRYGSRQTELKLTTVYTDGEGNFYVDGQNAKGERHFLLKPDGKLQLTPRKEGLEPFMVVPHEENRNYKPTSQEPQNFEEEEEAGPVDAIEDDSTGSAGKEWHNDVPGEVWSRLADAGRAETLADALDEARYMLTVIQDGGSDYDSMNPKERNQLVNKTKRFIQKWGEKPVTPKEIPEETSKEEPRNRSVTDNADLNLTNRPKKVLNDARRGVELHFPEKPDEATRKRLKDAGWKYHKKGDFWYTRNTPDSVALADELAGGNAEPELNINNQEPENAPEEPRQTESDDSRNTDVTEPENVEEPVSQEPQPEQNEKEEVENHENRRDTEETPADVPTEDVRGPQEEGSTEPVDSREEPTRDGGVDGSHGPTSSEGPRTEGSRSGTENPTPRERTDDGVGTDTRRPPAEPRAGDNRVNEPRQDFVITDELNELGGPKTKFKNNVAAIRVLRQLQKESRKATPEEQAALAKYVGWGGLPQAFDRFNREWEKEYKELRSLVDDGLITEEEYANARNTTRFAHYTSPQVIRAMYAAIRRLGFAKGRVLEPSMGTGNFFGLMPPDMIAGRVGVEYDPLTGAIAQQLYQKANIQIKPFQQFAAADNTFDLVIGNPPYHKRKVTDDKRYASAQASLHNYFFLKSLDKVREGGLVAFVTSTGTLDNQNPKIRRMIAEKADFLGAVRLPNHAFLANAGTNVTTDIIFLQKRPANQAPRHAGNFVDTVPSGIMVRKTAAYNADRVPLFINKYFRENPDMVLGKLVASSMYSSEDTTLAVETDGRDVEAAIVEAIEKLPADIYRDSNLMPDIEPEKQPLFDEKVADNESYHIQNGRVFFRQDGKDAPVTDANDHMLLKPMVEIRDTVRKLFRLQRDDHSDKEIQAAQKQLNEQYDRFVKHHGYLNKKTNRQLFQQDVLGTSILLSLEDNYRIEKKGKKTVEMADKSDIFTKRIISGSKPLDQVDNVADGLVLSLYTKGRVDIPHIAKLTKKDEAEVIEALGDAIYYNPQTGWETADQYLSGNVRVKLAEARALAKENPEYERNVEALEKVQPADLVPSQIAAPLGAGWIPQDVVATFVEDALGLPKGSVNYVYAPTIAKWTSNVTDERSVRISAKNTNEFGTPDITAIEIIDHILNNKDIEIKVKDEDGEKKKDLQRTEAARNKAERIRQYFKQWVWAEPERAERLARLYNDNFNATVLRVYNGEKVYGPETQPRPIPGLHPIYKLRKWQKDVVWRTIQGGNTLYAHQVGAGKTLEIATAAMELKRLGLVQKPAIVVPTSLVEQWEREFKQYFPGAKVLTLHSKNIPAVINPKTDANKKLPAHELEAKIKANAADRAAALNKIATSTFDALIISQETFTRMPMSAEEQERYTREELEDTMAALDAMRDGESSSRDIKKMEDKRDELQDKLRGNVEEIAQDIAIPFEELGIDQIFVDESHKFKNLYYTTSRSNVAGLSQSKAKRATDMYMKTRWLTRTRNGHGVVFATGTPVSNTMAEMFNIQRFLQYDQLKDAGLTHFDAWANMFGEMTTDVEMNAAGEFKEKSRFARFINLPELMGMFRQVADILMNLPLPVPDNVVRETFTIPKSKFLRDYMLQLAARADAVSRRAVEPEEDNYLKITGDGRKAALDIRLVDPSLPDDPDSKINVAVGKILEIYKNPEIAKQKNGEIVDKHTQVVFLDMGIPKAEDPKKKKKESDEDDEDFSTLDTFSQSLYEDIRDKLVKKGIPKEEIRFIHEAKSKEAKTKIIEDFNDGKIRVLIGSSEKMGAGVNMQRRLVALHHIDAPWKPSDVEQREGRIIRQKNLNNTVYVYNYVTKGSFDAIIWRLILGKAKFIAQVMTGDMSVRTAEDVDEVTASFAEIYAEAVENPHILEENRLRKEKDRLRSLLAEHERNQIQVRREIKELGDRIRELKKSAKDYETDIQTRIDTAGDRFQVVIDGKSYDNRAEAAEALHQFYDDHASTVVTMDSEKEVGTFAGFPVLLQKSKFMNKAQFVIQGKERYKFEQSDSAAGTLRRMENAVASMDNLLKWEKQSIDDNESKKANLEKLGETPFPDMDKLEDVEQKHIDILLKLEEFNREQAARLNGEAPVPQPEDYERTYLPGWREASTTSGEPRLYRQNRKYQSTQELYNDYLDTYIPRKGDSLKTQREKGSRAKSIDAEDFTDVARPYEPSELEDPNEEARGIEHQIIEPENEADIQSYIEGRHVLTTDSPEVRTTKTVTRSQIVKFVQDKFGVLVGTGRVEKPKHLATYNRSSHVIRTKNFADFEAIAHELGHALDRDGEWSKNDDHKIELRNLARGLQIPAGMKVPQVLREGFAEFLHLYLTDHAALVKLAPDLLRAFENQMTEEGRLQDLRTLQEMMDIWTGQSPEQRLRSAVADSANKGQTSPVEWAHKVYTQYINEQHPIEDGITKALGKKILVQLPSEENTIHQVNRWRGTDGKAETFIDYGTVKETVTMDEDGNYTSDWKRTGDSLEEILESVPNLDTFVNVLVALRAKELLDQGRHLTPAAMEDIRRYLSDEFERTGSIYFEAAARLYAYQHALLGELVDAGLLSRAKYQDILREHRFYVPFYRVMDDTGEQDKDSSQRNYGKNRKFANLQSPLVSMKEEGSSRNIINPIESIVKNTYVMLSLAERNKVGRSLLQLVQQYPEEMRSIAIIKPGAKTKVPFVMRDINKALGEDSEDADDTVRLAFKDVFTPKSSLKELQVFEDGEPVILEIRNKAFFDAILALEPESLDWNYRFLRYPAQALRRGIVHTPAFQAANLIRSTPQIMLQSDTFRMIDWPMLLTFDLPRAFFNIFLRDEHYWKWKSTGGGNATITYAHRHFMDEKTKQMRRLSSRKRNAAHRAMQVPRGAWEWYSRFIDGLTGMFKLAEHRRALKRTGSLSMAAVRSRDMDIDHKRAGTTGKKFNQISIFYNAAVQGLDVLIRTAAKHPIRTAARGFTLLTLPTILLWMMNKDDDEYWELTQEERDMNWLFKVNGEWKAIPIPFEWGLIFKTGMEYILQNLMTEHPAEFKEYASRWWKYSTPNMMASVLYPFIELMTGVRWGTWTPITPRGTERLLPEDQYDESTSETFKMLGKWFHMPPKRAETFFRGLFGSVGDLGIATADEGLRRAGVVSDEPTPSQDGKFVRTAFTGRFQKSINDGSTQSIDELYDHLDDLENEHARTGVNGKPGKELQAYRKARDYMADMRRMRAFVMRQPGTTEEKKAFNTSVNKALRDISRDISGKEPLDPDNYRQVIRDVESFVKWEAQQKKKK